MNWFILYICGLLFTVTTAHPNDPGGLTARFTPEEAKPGDLIVLSVEMQRDEFAKFALEVPSHPRLHLVSREPIPLTISNGHYCQGERLMLQALSSGPLTLSGIQVELTESTGTRTVALPELTLKVIPFDTEDTKETPQPFPKSKDRYGSRSTFITNSILLIGIVVLVVLIRRKQPGKGNVETASSPTTLTIAEDDFENILDGHGATLSPKLRSDLEAFIYGETSSEKDSSDILSRLRKELG